MKCYIIVVQLESGDYSQINSLAESYGAWARITETSWAVVSENTSKAIRDDFAGMIKSGDRLFVIKSGVGAAWRNTIASSEWLKKNL